MRDIPLAQAEIVDIVTKILNKIGNENYNNIFLYFYIFRISLG